MSQKPILQRLQAHSQRLFHSRIALGGLVAGAILIIAGLLVGPPEAPEEIAVESQAKVSDLRLPGQREPAEVAAAGQETEANELALAEPKRAEATEDIDSQPLDEGWDVVTVRSGQTLDGIFREQGYSIGLLHEIIALNGDTKNLARIKPGQEFHFKNDAEGAFRAMRTDVDETLRLTIQMDEGELSVGEEFREIERRLTNARGVINDSLFLSAKEAGMSDNLIMELANIFGWDIDFILDIRSGDRFYVIYEQLFRDGVYLRDGDILAASFYNQGDQYRAFAYDAGEGSEFFNPEGRNMKKAFLRAPLNFSYVSSNFNPKRFHPILKRVKAHNGIDYRAPQGTPVYAAGKGKVIRSAYSKYNGHHVFIQHGNSIVTKYLHFTKRTVGVGDRVKQGQVIGYVGATGLAEAPHLHYEFVVNGVHRNPRTVDLPKAEALPEAQVAQFHQAVAPLMAQLAVMEKDTLLASKD